jgi:hypothetical protein
MLAGRPAVAAGRQRRHFGIFLRKIDVHENILPQSAKQLGVFANFQRGGARTL